MEADDFSEAVATALGGVRITTAESRILNTLLVSNHPRARLVDISGNYSEAYARNIFSDLGPPVQALLEEKGLITRDEFGELLLSEVVAQPDKKGKDKKDKPKKDKKPKGGPQEDNDDGSGTVQVGGKKSKKAKKVT